LTEARTLMVQGTTSHCGKSVLVAALCKIFADAGYRVAPFKSQNMSLNSYVTESGEEIARAQAMQAFAAGIEPSAEMNPILLKPKGNMVSQVVFKGKPYKDLRAKDYFTHFALKEGLKGASESLKKLMSKYELIVIEGAGSPAEINLYQMEIANMRIADMANAPVLLVADIDRGGALASLIGTLDLLKKPHRDRVEGFVLNKFRGDLGLLEPGLRKLERMTRKPVLGVLPYIEDFKLPSEDSVSLEEPSSETPADLDLVVIRFPRISNFTDFDPLKFERGVRVRLAKSPDEVGDSDAVILPGTKNTVQDIVWLKEQGLASRLVELSSKGIPILGLCGGYQMLGKTIIDEKGLESGVAGQTINGLGLLDIVTRFDAYEKATNRVAAQVVGSGSILGSVRGEVIHGYEIHMGTSILGKASKPIFKIIRSSDRRINRFDGAVDERGLVFGTYIHGIFDFPPVRKAFIEHLMKQKGLSFKSKFGSVREAWKESLERLAKIVTENLDMKKICGIVGLSLPLG